MKILAVETSCDETAVAILEAPRLRSGQAKNIKNSVFNILSNVVSSQVKIHAKWGGVVPSLAKREHQANLTLVLKKALKKSNLLEIYDLRDKNYEKNLKSKILNLNSVLEREPELLKKIIPFLKKYKKPKIDAITVVNGPGLEPALWVGINFAKALSVEWDIPLYPINHMEGHLYSVFLPEKAKNSKRKTQSNSKKFKIKDVKFPVIGLLVSGGHTELILVKNWLNYKIIGQTRDDAAGEAFDKLAKMLGLGYPGGPAVARRAQNYLEAKLPSALGSFASKLDIVFPRPMLNSKDYDFSFSGLKTSALYKIRELENKEHKPINQELKTMICHEFQNAVIDVLVVKTLRAAKEYKAKTIILGGGVAANDELRNRLSSQLSAISSQPPAVSGQIKLFLPEKKYTGDNAAMAALAAYFRYYRHRKSIVKIKPGNIIANGNLKLA